MTLATTRLATGVVVVISPHPVTPSSVDTSTKRNSPQYVPGASTSHGFNDAIFIGRRPPNRLFLRRVRGPSVSQLTRTLHHRGMAVHPVLSSRCGAAAHRTDDSALRFSRGNCRQAYDLAPVPPSGARAPRSSINVSRRPF